MTLPAARTAPLSWISKQFSLPPQREGFQTSEKWKRKMMNKRNLLLSLLLLFVLAVSPACAEVYLQEPPADWADKELLTWTIFDVGQGDCMLLTCGEESMMVDGGVGSYRDKLAAALDARGLRHMRYILNTHFHGDHVDGLYHLFKNGFTADEYLQPHDEQELARSEEGTRALKAAADAGVPMRRIGQGDTISLGNANIDVYRCLEVNNDNARSLVLKVTFGESTILLTADITGKAQHWYVENMPESMLSADLMKLPHHSITPTVPELLNAVNPSAAVATTGKKIVSGKSSAQLTSRKLPHFYSGDGTVYAVTDGTDWYMYQTKYKF